MTEYMTWSERGGPARRWARNLALVAGAAMLSTACLPTMLSQALLDFGHFEMQAAQSCDELETSLKSRALVEARQRALGQSRGTGYDPSGFANTSGGAARHSITNAQEDGVDEADIFKVDGDYAYVLHGNMFLILEAYQAGNRNIHQKAAVSIDGTPFEMYIAGDRALVMTRTTHDEVKAHFQADAPNRPDSATLTKAMVFDIRDRTAPKLLREVMVEGDHIASRRVGEQVFIISEALLDGPQTADEEPNDAKGSTWYSKRKAAIESSTLSDWLPHYYDIKYDDEGVASSEAQHCSCANTWKSDAASGDDALAIYSIDLRDGASSAIQSASILADGAIVYGSRDSLVVATTNYAEKTYTTESEDEWTFLFGDDEDWDDDWDDDNGQDNGDGTRTEVGQVTYLHRFELGEGGKVRYDASGQVDGWLLNAFSISEHQGVLRVATQVGEFQSLDTETRVYTLKAASKDKANYLTRGKQSNFLAPLGEITGIAPGEDLYAVRFKGDIGYLITFQETDPLWTIDLSSPSNPRIRGELMVPGFSTYLHPIHDGLLIGVGRSGWQDGEGVKLSIFDVKNLDNPRALVERNVGEFTTTSGIEDTHKTFHWMADKNLMALPIQTHNVSGLHLYRADRSGLKFETIIEHDVVRDNGSTERYPKVLRSHRIDNHLYSYSSAGIVVVDMSRNFDTVATMNLQDL